MKQSDIDKKVKNFASLDEYKDALMFFDINTGNNTYDNVKDRIVSIFNDIYEEYGSIITIPRMNYLLMKKIDINRYDAQHLIQTAMDHGIIKWGCRNELIKVT
jgi:hypothetical protein